MIIRKGVKKRNPSFSPPFHRFFMQDCQIQILRIVKKEWLLSPSFLLRRLLLLETRKRLQANYGFIQYCSKTLSIINIVVKIGRQSQDSNYKVEQQKKIAMRNFATLLLLQVFFIAAPIRKRLITLQKLTFYCSKVKLTLVNRGFMFSTLSSI